NRITHVVPLCPMALELLRSVPRYKDGDYIFSTTGGKIPVRSFDRIKTRLDDKIAERIGGNIPGWVIHDLRRSVRTNLSICGVEPFVAELVISHQQKGVAAIYDRFTYDEKKRDALMRWERKLLSLVEPTPTNVVPLRQHG